MFFDTVFGRRLFTIIVETADGSLACVPDETFIRPYACFARNKPGAWKNTGDDVSLLSVGRIRTTNGVQSLARRPKRLVVIDEYRLDDVTDVR